MTPRRRFLSAVYRGNVDKIPACTLSSVVTVEMMDLVDAPFPEAHLDAEKMARLAATAHDVFGMDTIMPVFHSQLESDALGGETEWAEKDNWPSPSRFTIEEPEQVVVPDDFEQRPTMAAVTGAIKLLRQRYPDVAIVGKVYGPWSVGYQMVGIESFLMDVMLDPDKIKRYLEAFVPACIALRAGPVRGRRRRGHVGRPHDRRPVSRRDLPRLPPRDAPAHHPGDGRAGHLPLLRQDHRPGPPVRGRRAGTSSTSSPRSTRARRASNAGERMALFGNLNNPSLLYQGTAEDVYKACWDLMDPGVDGLAPEGPCRS